MSAIRHGRETLPAYATRVVPASTRFRCGWCEFTGTRDEVDAHEDATHAEHLRPYAGADHGPKDGPYPYTHRGHGCTADPETTSP